MTPRTLGLTDPLHQYLMQVGFREHQELKLVEKRGESFRKTTLEGCRFVPLVGYHGWQDPPSR